MALQTKTFTWGSYEYQSASRSYVLELILTENSVDQSANTSNISYELLLHSGSNNRFSGQIDSVLTLNGVQVDTGSRQISAQYNSAWTLLEGTADVAHNDDGSLDMPIGVSIETYNSYAPPDTTLSWSWVLTDIPRQSAFGSITGATLGETMRVNIQRASDRFTHIVYYYKGNDVWSAGASGETYVDISLPLSLAELSADSDTFDLLLLLRTYDADTQIGDDVKVYIPVTIPENEQTKPTVTLTLTPREDLNGWYLQERTGIQGSLTAQGQYGAEIQSLTMTVDGKTYDSPWYCAPLTKPGDYQVVARAVDSRGFTQSVTQTVTVLPYYKPKFTALQAYRCDGAGEPAEDGQSLYLSAAVDHCPLEGQNDCQLTFRLKAQEGAWSDYQSLTAGVAPDITLDPQLAYTIQLSARDTAGSQSLTTIAIPSEAVYIHRPAGGKAMGLGGYVREEDLLDIYWNVNARQSLTAQSVNFRGVCEDLNGVYLPGVYRFTAATANNPWGEGLLLVVNGFEDPRATTLFQLAVTTTGKVFTRLTWNGVRQSWKTITA